MKIKILFICILGILNCNSPDTEKRTLSVTGCASRLRDPYLTELSIEIQAASTDSQKAAQKELKRRAENVISVLKSHDADTATIIKSTPIFKSSVKRCPSEDMLIYTISQQIVTRLIKPQKINIIKRTLLDIPGVEKCTLSMSYSSCDSLIRNLTKEATQNAKNTAISINDILGTRTGLILKVLADTSEKNYKRILCFDKNMLDTIDPKITISHKIHVTYWLRR